MPTAKILASKRTTLRTRVEENPAVVQATEQVVAAQRELDTITTLYHRTRKLVEGQDIEGGCSEEDRIQAYLDLPKQTEQFFLARLHLSTREEALKEAREGM